MSIFLFYAGMEVSAVHVNEVDNTEKNYPLAILISAGITVAIFVFGTLAIVFVIPQKDINLTQSMLVAYRNLFQACKAGYLPPILQRTNKHGVQVNILYFQSAIVTILSVIFVLLPSVQAAYQILSALTVTMYLIMDVPYHVHADVRGLH